MSILKKQTADTSKQLNIRVSANLAAELEELRESARRHNFTIDLEPAIAAAVKKARRDLSAMDVAMPIPSDLASS